MARYYNRENGSLSLTLRGGKSVTIVGKQWVEIPTENEGSEDLVTALRKGHLYRFAEPVETPKTAAVKAEKSAPVVAEPEAAVESAVKEDLPAAEIEKPFEPRRKRA